MKALWAALLGAAAALAQFEPGAVVAGTITSQSGGAPVRKADVALYRVDVRPGQPQGPLTTRTDPEGKFLFPNVPSGHYRLIASANGFEQVSYGARSSDQPGRLLLLGPNETHLDANIALRPTGVITGTVIDATGQPLRNVNIALLRPVYERGRARYVPAQQGNTNDRGQYRIFGIRAGSYRVAALGSPLQFPQPHGPAAGPPEPIKVSGPQFYPNSPRFEGAEVLRVTPGKEFRNINFQLTMVPAAHLKGRVVPPPGLETNVSVLVNVIGEDAPGWQHHSNGTDATPPSFEFAVDGLRPGRYQVLANLRAGNRSFQAAQSVEIGPGGVDNFALPIAPPVELKGSVKVEGGAAAKFVVQLVSAGTGPALMMEQPNTQVHEDGSFVLPSVMPGLWNIDVQPIPRGGYIKSMRLGDDDVLDKDISLSSGAARPLHIVINLKGATLDGEVDIPQTHVGLEASVLLAPEGNQREVLRLYQLRGINTEGEFRMEGISPGSYRVYAFAELNHRAYQDPAFLTPYAEHGIPIEIKEGERAVMPKRVPLIVPGVIALE